MQAYTDYFSGKLMNQDYDPKALEESLAHLPKVAAHAVAYIHRQAPRLGSRTSTTAPTPMPHMAPTAWNAKAPSTRRPREALGMLSEMIVVRPLL